MKPFTHLIIFLLLGLSLQAQRSYSEAIQQGDAAFNSGQYKTAIDKYFAAEAFDPSREAHVKAKLDRVFSRIEQLRQDAEEAKEEALRQKQKADQALATLQRTAEKTVELLLEQSDRHISRIEYEEARAKMELAYEFDPAHLGVKLRLFELLFVYAESEQLPLARRVLTLISKQHLENEVGGFSIDDYRLAMSEIDSEFLSVLNYKYFPTLVSIDGGKFLMGGQDFDEKPIHAVRVSDFAMSQTELTVYQYNLYALASRTEMDPLALSWTGYHPKQLDWNQAVDYCNWLSGRANKAEVYTIEEGESKWQRNVIADWTSAGYRLPTEAEWEYAVRYTNNENLTARYDADTPAELSNLQSQTMLYDMTNGLWEWCWDYYARYEGDENTVQNDPRGPSTGDSRVRRGGSWTDHDFMRTHTYRVKAYGGSDQGTGCRLVLSLAPLEATTNVSPIPDQPQSQAVVEDSPGTGEVGPEGVITVSNLDEFLAAIGSDRTIRLMSEEFIMSDIPVGARGEHYYLYTETDGYELVIIGVENLSIIGGTEKPTKLTTRPVYGDVLLLRNCNNILLENIEAGHGPEKGGCTGGVLNIEDCRNIHIKNSILYGSGTEGITASKLDGLLLENTVIHGCTYNIMTLSVCENARFIGCVFRDNEMFTMINISESVDIVFDDCVFKDNTETESYWHSRESLFGLDSSTGIKVMNSVITGNYLMGGLTNDEESLTIIDTEITNNDFGEIFEEYDAAELAYDEGRLADAMRHYEAYFAAGPPPDQHWQAKNKLGHCYMLNGRFEDAIAYYKKSYEANSRSEHIYLHNTAYAYMKAQQPAEALPFIVEVRKTKLSVAYIHRLEGFYHVLIGEQDEAIEAFQLAIENGYDVWPWFKTEPLLEDLRQDQRFLDLIKDN